MGFLNWLFGSKPAAPAPPATPARPAAAPTSPDGRVLGFVETADGPLPALWLTDATDSYPVLVQETEAGQPLLKELAEASLPERTCSVRLRSNRTDDGPHGVVVQTFKGRSIGRLDADDAGRIQMAVTRAESDGFAAVCQGRFKKRGSVFSFWLDLALPASSASPKPSRRSTASIIDAFEAPTKDGFFFEVVGESHYQDALRALSLTTNGARECRVVLKAEPSNVYDTSAVAIQTLDGSTVGYMRRDEARKFQPLLLQLDERKVTATCHGKLFGGTDDKPSIGIYLNLSTATEFGARMGVKMRRRAKASTRP